MASDVVGNVLLYLPFGFLGVRSFTRSMLGLIVTLALAAALSAAVELFQSYGHARIPSATDFCCNVIGALLGGFASRGARVSSNSAERPETT